MPERRGQTVKVTEQKKLHRVIKELRNEEAVLYSAGRGIIRGVYVMWFSRKGKKRTKRYHTTAQKSPGKMKRPRKQSSIQVSKENQHVQEDKQTYSRERSLYHRLPYIGGGCDSYSTLLSVCTALQAAFHAMVVYLVL